MGALTGSKFSQESRDSPERKGREMPRQSARDAQKDTERWRGEIATETGRHKETREAEAETELVGRNPETQRGEQRGKGQRQNRGQEGGETQGEGEAERHRETRRRTESRTLRQTETAITETQRPVKRMEIKDRGREAPSGKQAPGGGAPTPTSSPRRLVPGLRVWGA